MLIFWTCAAMSQTIVRNDSLILSHSQVRNVYKGLKEGEIAKQNLKDCLEIANSLNGIIQGQNDSIQASVLRINNLNTDISKANADYTKKSVELQQLKDKKTPWYKHPILYSVLGLLTGIWITK